MKSAFALFFVLISFLTQTASASISGPIYFETGGSIRTPLFKCVAEQVRSKYNFPANAEMGVGEHGTAFDVVLFTKWEIFKKYRSFFVKRAIHEIEVMVQKCPTCTDSERRTYNRLAHLYISYDFEGASWSAIRDAGSGLLQGIKADSVNEIADVLYQPYVDGKYEDMQTDKIDISDCAEKLRTRCCQISCVNYFPLLNQGRDF